MTISMPDSTVVENLPDGYPAYLGYADGQWPTGAALAGMFPAAHRVILTVNGSTISEADGIDCEPGNINAAGTRVWVQRKLIADPGFRPVIYASILGEPNYGMLDVLAALQRNRIARERVRLLTAHYGAGMHICSPRACRAGYATGITADGTQWTNSYLLGGGITVDMSLLNDNFFGAQNRTGTEKIVQELGTVRQGSTGETVRTAQGCLLARGYAIGVSGVLTAGVDGVFGPLTLAAVRQVQAKAGITVDGVVGPQTWPVLLGVA
jgi:Putative peptidoglycan binding domain